MSGLLYHTKVLREFYLYCVKRIKLACFRVTHGQLINAMKKETSCFFNIPFDSLNMLGVGHEGIVFTDNSKAYKVLFCRLTNIDILRKVADLSEMCSVLLPIEINSTENYDIISRPFLDSNSHKVSMMELRDFMTECKTHGLLYWDFKKENFLEIDGKSRLIDYGISFEQYEETVFKQSCLKAFLLASCPNIKPWLFKFVSKQIDNGVYSESYFGQQIINVLKQENFIDLLFVEKSHV